MRAIVDAKEFSQALDQLCRLPARSSIPALEGVYVSCSNGRCTLTTTDLTAWLTAEIPAQGDDFAFVLPRVKGIAKACRRFHGGLALELTATGVDRDRQLRLCLRCGSRTGEFGALPPEDCPKRPEQEADHTFTVNAAYLSARISRVSYPARRLQTEGGAERACVQFCGGSVFSLDSHRLAWDTDGAAHFPEDFLVPAAPLEHLKAFGAQDVTVRLGKSLLEITGGELCLQIRRALSEPFPLDSAIPSQYREEISVSPREFLEELKYLEEMAPSSRAKAFRFCGGQLQVAANGCRYSTEIHVDGVSHIEIGLRRSYMVEALQQFKTEPRVRMKLSSSVAPVILEADGRSDRAMVLPVRLRVLEAA